MMPLNSTIDASQSNIFTSTIRVSGGSSCTGYIIQIYLNTTANTLVYTNTVTLSTVLYDQQTLSIPLIANVLINGNSYKWVLKLTQDNSTYVSSYENVFYTHLTPVMTIPTIVSPVTQNSYLFTANYVQPDGDPMSWFEFILYDNLGNELSNSGELQGVIQWECSGLLNNTTYGIACVGASNSGVGFSSPIYPFTVQFSEPFIPNNFLNPQLTINYERDSVSISNVFTQINGSAEGTYSYGTYSNGQSDVIINTNSEIYWDTNLSIPENFTVEMSSEFPVNFEGEIIDLTNTVSNTLYRVYYAIDRITLINSTNSFTIGTNNEYIYPLNFEDVSNIQLAFNGLSNGNIINPQFVCTDGTRTSLLTILGTIGQNDRFVWDGSIGYINNIPVSTTGNLQAYKNGIFTIQNTKIIPNLELTYQMSSGHMFYVIDNNTYNIPFALQANISYKFGLLPTNLYIKELS
jgi:hypothetical protein